MIGKLKAWWNQHILRRHWFLVVFEAKSYLGETKSYRSFNKKKTRNFTVKDVRDLEELCEGWAKESGHVKPSVVIRNIIYMGKMSIATWNAKS